MTDAEIAKIGKELRKSYPGCQVKVAEDRREMVAEVSDGFAIAVIERSVPHFHLHTREVYRILSGTLYLACAGKGHVLREGETITITPGQIHFARAAEKPVWLEVESVPAWSSEDHFVLGE